MALEFFARVFVGRDGVFLLVDAFALPLQTFFIFSLLVIYVFLETVVHFQSRIEPVFDCVVSSSGHEFGNKWPLFAVLEVQIHKPFVFFQGPLVFGDVWVQVIVPSFAALLSYSAWKHRSNEVPSPSSVLNYKLLELLVFLFSPRRLGASLALILLLQTQVPEFLVEGVIDVLVKFVCIWNCVWVLSETLLVPIGILVLYQLPPLLTSFLLAGVESNLFTNGSPRVMGSHRSHQIDELVFLKEEGEQPSVVTYLFLSPEEFRNFSRVFMHTFKWISCFPFG